MGNVYLILNPFLGHVSPQFHAIFDDDFTLAPTLRANTVHNIWADLVPKSAESATNLDIGS